MTLSARCPSLAAILLAFLNTSPAKFWPSVTFCDIVGSLDEPGGQVRPLSAQVGPWPVLQSRRASTSPLLLFYDTAIGSIRFAWVDRRATCRGGSLSIRRTPALPPRLPSPSRKSDNQPSELTTTAAVDRLARRARLVGGAVSSFPSVANLTGDGSPIRVSR